MKGYVVIIILAILILIAGGCLYWGFKIEVKRVKAQTYQLELPNLPSVWQQRKIIYFSDLHVGEGLPLERLDYFIDLIRQEEPDILLFGGDLTEGAAYFTEVEQKAYLEGLARLRDLAPLGFYAVRGNHDCDAGASTEFFDLAMTAMGARKLANQGLIIDGLRLIGLDDYMFGHSDLPAALAQSESAEEQPVANLILLHEPDPAASYIRQTDFGETSIFLSGHSHNGQIKPFGLQLYHARYGKDYGYGLYDFPQEQAQLIVSAGLGTVGIPARFAAPPEYVVIQLQS